MRGRGFWGGGVWGGGGCGYCGGGGVGVGLSAIVSFLGMPGGGGGVGACVENVGGGSSVCSKRPGNVCMYLCKCVCVL